MACGRKAESLERSSLTMIELKVEDLSKTMEGLRAAGTASDEEANAFADCIEDLWVRIITLRRERLRGEMVVKPQRERVRMVLSVIRMLEGDLEFAREREHR